MLKYGVTLIGIRRGQEQITAIRATELLLGGDFLIVTGQAGAIRAIKNQSPLL